jgi:curved DNA-binding protein CbpA
MRLGDVLATDLYGVLGVERDSSTEEIRRAYRRLAMLSHPDLMHEDREAAERRMVELNVAASVLLDPARRRAYDRARSAGPRARTGRWDLWWVTSAFRGSEEWVCPRDVPVTRLEGELGEAVRSFRSWPSRKLEGLLRVTTNRSPSAHAVVTVASVGLALLLISIAKPRSLFPLFPQETARVALSAPPTST